MGDLWVPLRDKRGAVVAHAVIDEVDAYLMEFPWHRTAYGYARRSYAIDGVVRCVFMHRQVLGLEIGAPRQVDHINRDRLDNRRENLRIATYAHNAQNRAPLSSGSSIYRGVTWSKQKQKWRARGAIDGHDWHVGFFDSEHEAGAAAAAWRAENMPFSEEALAR